MVKNDIENKNLMIFDLFSIQAYLMCNFPCHDSKKHFLRFDFISDKTLKKHCLARKVSHYQKKRNEAKF